MREGEQGGQLGTRSGGKQRTVGGGDTEYSLLRVLTKGGRALLGVVPGVAPLGNKEIFFFFFLFFFVSPKLKFRPPLCAACRHSMEEGNSYSTGAVFG